MTEAARWNYRLTVETCDDTEIWAVRELYYDADDRVTAWSQDPAYASGDTWRECADDLSRMLGVIGQHPAYDIDARQWCDRKRRPKEVRSL